jgi:hypothetical protein
VVVDNARRMISKTIDIVVTSVLQTTAGKMIFGRHIEPGSPAPSSAPPTPAPAAGPAPAPVGGAALPPQPKPNGVVQPAPQGQGDTDDANRRPR